MKEKEVTLKPQISFDEEVRITRLIDVWTKIRDDLHSITLNEQLEFQSGSRKFLNYGRYTRILASLPRLSYLTDRLRDLNFITIHLDEKLALSNNQYDKKYINSYLFLDIPSTIKTVVNSLLNFISYYYDLDSKDRELNSEEVLNYLSIVDKGLAKSLELFLSNEYIKGLNDSCLSIENAYIGMNRLSNGRKGKKRKIQIFFDHDNHSQKMLDLVNLTLTKLSNFTKVFEENFTKSKTESEGYSSPNDIFTKIDPETKLLKGSQSKQQNEEANILYLKIFNLFGEFPPTIEYPTFSIYKNITYERAEEKLYRPSKSVRRTIDLTTKKPVKVEEVIYPVSGGEMLWTNTLKIDKKGIKNFKRFKEDLSLILSLFNKNAVFIDEEHLHYSHKGSSHTYLKTQDYRLSLGKALSNLHKKGNKTQTLIRGLLRDYKEIKQPQSFTSDFIKLWNIIDKLGTYSFIKPKTKDRVHNALDKAINFINSEVALKELNLSQPLKYLYSISKQNEQLFKNTLQIHKLLDIDYSVFKSEVKILYGYRSQLVHTPDIHLNKALDKDIVYHYFFLYNLVFLIFLKLLNITPQFTYPDLVKDMVGFLNDKNYYEALSQEKERSSQEFQKMFDALSGKTPLPSDGIHVNL